MKIRPAKTLEAAAISALALRSKAHWGYSDKFMQQCRDELTYSERDIAKMHFFVLVDGDCLIGFYALKAVTELVLELEALFIEPEWIGKGAGKRLFDHAIETARNLNAHKITIQSDPYAATFYQKMGAKQVGERASENITGRSLPVFEITF